jgi:HD-like signal output (HDOD) protein
MPGIDAAIAIAIVIVMLAVGWWVYRRWLAPRQPSDAKMARPAPAAAEATPEASRLAAANAAAAERLWALAYAVPFAAHSSDVRAHNRVRDNIVAVLEVDRLDPRYFPRRPALMPQLLQAINDPQAAVERISRMIAHDPVLTADVLRMANSSRYRTSEAAIETIPRAIVICGVEALRGMLAAAMLQPVFRANRKNFPRLPRMLWDRTELASRAAELYALRRHPQDRFEAQLLVLLNAIGPLVVYGAIVDVYSRNSHLSPSPSLCIELTRALGSPTAIRIARDWQLSARLIAALDATPQESLRVALQFGELLGTLAFLESRTVISAGERTELLGSSGMPEALVTDIWSLLTEPVGAP